LIKKDKDHPKTAIKETLAKIKIGAELKWLPEMSVAELCRKYTIHESQFYKWNKEFLEAGKKRLSGDTTREATSDEVVELRKENQRLKEIVADLVLRYDIVKKSLSMLD